MASTRTPSRRPRRAQARERQADRTYAQFAELLPVEAGVEFGDAVHFLGDRYGGTGAKNRYKLPSGDSVIPAISSGNGVSRD
jgi:hypothetical protein